MKNKSMIIVISVFILLNLNNKIFAQQWGGATNQTGTIARIGSVGIGSNSTVTALLQLSHATSPELKLATTNSPVVGTLLGKISSGSTLAEYMGSSNSSINFISEGTWTPGYRKSGISFFTSEYSSPSTERMRIASSGNIGIGTINPAYKLEVNGTSLISGNAIFSSKVGIGNTNPNFTLDVNGTSNISGNATFGQKVGIGVSAPTYNLELNGTFRIVPLSGSSTRMLVVNDLGVISAQTIPSGGGSGDNLGNHIASQNIKLGNFWLSNSGNENSGIKIGPGGFVGINTDPSEIYYLKAAGPTYIDGPLGVLTAPDLNNTYALKIFGNALATSWIVSSKGSNLKNTTEVKGSKILGKVKDLTCLNIESINSTSNSYSETWFNEEKLKEVFPELIKSSTNSPSIEAINISGLIPNLIVAIQEQQKQIDFLLKKLEILETHIQDITTNSSGITQSLSIANNEAKNELLDGSLINIFPNPVNSNTRVEYYLPESNSEAVLIILSISGEKLISIPLNSKGKSSIELDLHNLTRGTYVYSLTNNGVVIDTKLFVKN